MRDDFPGPTKDDLARRVAYLCSNPSCRQVTSGPKLGPAGSVSIGVAAHITAAAPGGPRYEDRLTAAGRSSGDNAIWLCQSCAKLVDSDLNRYPVARLREWKADAEAAAAKALEHRRSPATESEGVFIEAERLMPELIAEMRQDIRSDESQLVRELVVLPSRGVIFGSEKPRFVYFQTEHPQLLLQVDWLEAEGLMIDVTPKNAPVYRLTAEFVRWLRDGT